jgi:hypothetical protein
LGIQVAIRQFQKRRLDEAAPEGVDVEAGDNGISYPIAAHIFAWFIQKLDYPTTFRRIFTAWAIFWCGCAVLFFILQFMTGDELRWRDVSPIPKLSTLPIAVLFGISGATTGGFRPRRKITDKRIMRPNSIFGKRKSLTRNHHND